MSQSNETSQFACPYCGEPNSCCLDPGEIGQTLVQDCWVCCRPIEICINYDPLDDTYSLSAHTDSE